MIGEREAILKVLTIGHHYGYGNLIDRLQMQWAIELVEKSGMTIPDACYTAGFEDKERISRIEKAGLKGMKEYCFQE